MEEKIRILLAEDDINLGSLLTQYLNAKGFDTDLFADGEKAFSGFSKNKYDICILDVMMPKKDGFSLAKDIRLINSSIPIIFLTAKTLKEDVLEGFKIGADDYMTKPFVMDELMFRIEAIMRRINKNGDGPTISDTYQLGIYNFDVNKQLLGIDDKIIKLTTKESELLALLCANKNTILERNFALKSIWKDDNYFNARSMDVYITKLRKHLSKDTSIEILNVHGKGYKLLIN
ncbi:MAG: response regulator transcription factor [Bacteroidales bacterium]|nr:response regulator transcription factor [Bacteroidales bacterium]MBN2758257.1 response regulator transcription factor [Bacteroidales bacterium]